MDSPSYLPVTKVWLQPKHLVSTAKILLAGHRLPAIGVVGSNQELLGTVSPLTLVGASDSDEVGKFLAPPASPIQISQSAREVSSQLIESTEDFLPVLDGETFVGLITAKSLIGRLRESFDPMTQLPWSDALREWGANQLRVQNEIAVIFIDLNQFGQFNKNHGHVVGDQVLKTVVAHLQSKIDPRTDLLVRYGGDEFAIGTLRDRDDADTLVDSLRESGKGLPIEGIGAQVGFSVGIYGGRRSKARNDVHVEANLDNLVNLASQNCLASKLTREVASKLPERELPQSHSMPVVETIQVDQDANSLTYVVLKSSAGQWVGTSLRMGRPIVESVAIATGKAMERAHPGSSVQIDSVQVVRAGSTELVTLETQITRGGILRNVTAEVEANDDLHSSVASGVISAFYAE